MATKVQFDSPSLVSLIEIQLTFYHSLNYNLCNSQTPIRRGKQHFNLSPFDH